MISRFCVFGASKKSLDSSHRLVVRSRGTAVAYRNCLSNFLSFRAAGGYPHAGPFLRVEMDEFLFLSSLTWQQKTVDQHRQALCKMFSVDLPRYKAAIPSYVRGRAYTETEFERILQATGPKHRLAVALLYHCGLRTEEVLRIYDIGLSPPSPDRPWPDDLFAGLKEFVLCTCTGKGGLTRKIAIPLWLYVNLEQHRLTQSATTRNRGKSFKSHFDIVGGQALSMAFTRASKIALGFSLGAHGLRYSYIQRRLAQLESLNFSPLDRLSICSSEVGHFRNDITLHYTTPRR